MTVDDRNVVDSIGIEKEGGTVVLTICDHRVWGDHSHLVALQNKLNDYFGFIESGQIYEACPDANGRSIRLDIACQFSPSIEGQRLLTQARQVAESTGWSLSWFVPDFAQPSVLADA
jgi:hypothetical protein